MFFFLISGRDKIRIEFIASTVAVLLVDESVFFYHVPIIIRENVS